MSDQEASGNYDSAEGESYSSERSKNFVEEQFEKVLSQSIDPNVSFYKEYCKLYLNNVQLIAQVKSAQESNRQLELLVISSLKPHNNNSFSQNHANPEEDHESTQEKKKRLRRTAGEIARHYVCNYERCQKSYGSEGSLNQHIKLKHSNGTSH